MDIHKINDLNNKLTILCNDIEQQKKDFIKYSKDELQIKNIYELKEAKLSLEYKSLGNPYNISKPTKEDLERMIKLELQDLYINLQLAKKQKEIVIQHYKMTETQVSTIQSRLSFAKEEMKLL